jgi:3-deoxy-D-manno-octulosonate 8-phosphate phosphatase (KDO 8-P phosphatase)
MDLFSKIAKIKIVLTDVDGVLTDGGLYYSSEGQVMKKFNVKDGMGCVLLKKSGLQTGLISSDSAPLIGTRGERLKMDYIHFDVRDKVAVLDEICAKNNITYENIAFIGDDVNDLDILKVVGFSAAPNDSVEEILEVVNFICKKKGGDGAYREYADLIRGIKEKQNASPN